MRGLSGPTRHRYYVQEDQIKMGSLHSRSTKHGYGVSVNGVSVSGGKSVLEERELYKMRSASGSGPTSKLEQSITENDSGSEENILPKAQLRERPLPPTHRPARGIVRTTEILISR